MNREWLVGSLGQCSMYRQTTTSMGLCSFLLGSLAFQQSDRKDREDFANEILPAYLKSSAQHKHSTLESLAYQGLSVHSIYKYRHVFLHNCQRRQLVS